MNVDEILADPAKALNLPAGAVVIHTLVIVEYLEPISDDDPRVPRIEYAVDDELTSYGAESYCRRTERLILRTEAEQDNEDT